MWIEIFIECPPISQSFPEGRDRPLKQPYGRMFTARAITSATLTADAKVRANMGAAVSGLKASFINFIIAVVRP